MPRLNQLQLKNITVFIKRLKTMLPNKELLEEFVSKLSPISSETTSAHIITDEMVVFTYPNGDSYSIHINDGIIESYYSQKSNGSFQRKKISYLNNLAFVNEDETICETDELTELPGTILRHTNHRTYKDNELVYQRNFTSFTTSNLRTNTCKTTSQEIFVSDDRIAYIREIEITNDELDMPKITYSKCCSYNPTPFNSLINERKRQEPFIYPSNENEFITSTTELIKNKTK